MSSNYEWSIFLNFTGPLHMLTASLARLWSIARTYAQRDGEGFSVPWHGGLRQLGTGSGRIKIRFAPTCHLVEWCGAVRDGTA